MDQYESDEKYDYKHMRILKIVTKQPELKHASTINKHKIVEIYCLESNLKMTVL